MADFILFNFVNNKIKKLILLLNLKYNLTLRIFMCDTFISLESNSIDNSIIFGKNSDREPNEAQSLEYHPPLLSDNTKNLKCTYIEIPQVKEKYGVLICRPFWMWGAEMGANTNGLVIGNEAVFTKMPSRKKGVLTGMDLLRLALERSKNSIQAIETITELIADYGQGGACGFENKNFFYHNSFLIADRKEAWVLETADKVWAARKIKNNYAISNKLTIGETFDLYHPKLIQTAIKNKWLGKYQEFNFAKCYTDRSRTKTSGCESRRNRANEINNQMSIHKAFRHLRDHGQNPDYNPQNHSHMDFLCSHSADFINRNAAQSVGSMIVHLNDKARTAWVTGTSAPCTSLFKPINLDAPDLPSYEAPGEKYNHKSLWWKHERLHRTILKDYPNFINLIKQDQHIFENDLVEQYTTAEENQKKIISFKAFKTADLITNKWLRKIEKNFKVKFQPKNTYKKYWDYQNSKSKLFN